MISSVLSQYSLFSFSVFDQSIILHIFVTYYLSLSRSHSVHPISLFSLSFTPPLPTQTRAHTHTKHAHTHSTVVHAHKTCYRIPLSTIYSSIFLHEYLHRINLNHTELKDLINYKRRSNVMLTTQCYICMSVCMFSLYVCVDRH